MGGGLINRLTAVIVLLVFLVACETINDFNPFDTNILPRCPTIKFLKDADKITAYKPGTGRDISDISYEAELTGFSGECEYFGDDGIYTSVTLTLQVSLDITLGPAEKTRRVKLNYFVAIPAFFPDPKGKSSFSRIVKFPRDRNSISFVDDVIEIAIPLNENRQGPGIKVFTGFELSKDQLEFNRQRNNASELGR